MKKTILRNPYLVWINHRNAIMVHSGHEGVIAQQTFPSNLEEQKRIHGEGSDKSGLFGHTVDHQQQHQNRQQQQFDKFLRQLLGHLDHPDGILILGPGDARHELEQILQDEKSLQGISIENRAAQKMPDHALRDAYLEFSGLA